MSSGTAISTTDVDTLFLHRDRRRRDLHGRLRTPLEENRKPASTQKVAAARILSLADDKAVALRGGVPLHAFDQTLGGQMVGVSPVGRGSAACTDQFEHQHRRTRLCAHKVVGGPPERAGFDEPLTDLVGAHERQPFEGHPLLRYQQLTPGLIEQTPTVGTGSQALTNTHARPDVAEPRLRSDHRVVEIGVGAALLLHQAVAAAALLVREHAPERERP